MRARATCRHFDMHGVPCGACGSPAHHMEVYPNGVRTVHIDSRKRPCDSVHSALKPPEQRVSRSLIPQGDSAPVRTPVPTDRKVS
jgi:hypothetical protein